MTVNRTYPWGSERRYNAFSSWFTSYFGERVQKVSLDAGFSCPNRDGTLGTGGCTYCSNDAFNPSYCSPDKSITQQLDEGIPFHQRRYRRARKYLAYFQAYTNTYAGINRLKELYSEALAYPGIIGLVIGTRPDCVNENLLGYLNELNRNNFIIVEYGIESVNDKTLKRINRGHNFEDAAKMVALTADRGIRTGAHFILGLPGESRQEIIDSASIISELPLNSIKLHQLQIFKGTEMAEEFLSDPHNFDLYTTTEYLDLVISFIERLNPAIMIERISSEAPPRFLADPRLWDLRTDEFLRLFENKLEEMDTWQGRLYNPKIK
jgi:uncharacterized protein